MISNWLSSSISWYWKWDLAWKLIFDQDPCTVSWSPSGASSSSHLTFNWSAKFVDMKSPRDPELTSTHAGCPSIWAVSVTGFGRTCNLSLTDAAFLWTARYLSWATWTLFSSSSPVFELLDTVNIISWITFHILGHANSSVATSQAFSSTKSNWSSSNWANWNSYQLIRSN